VVTDIDPECPAYKAEGGLRVGDVITEIDRKPVRSLDDAYELSRNIKRNSVLLRVWNKNGSRWVLVDLDSSK
jgi:C-terminal processing protease CtpA/Prc